MRTGHLRAANLANSARLQRVETFLRSRGEHGATTMEIITGANVVAVNSAAAELRANGLNVECTPDRKTDDGMAVYRYRLLEAK